MRTALSMQRRVRLDRPVDEAEAVACAVDPELDAIKAESRALFEAALKDAVAALPARARTILRLHYVDGMTGDALAKMYGVHRITVSRWLVDARAEIREAMTRALRDRLTVASAELPPLLSLIRSRLDVSLGALLRERGA
jgi:RNA polymerase sigma-70 factor (ECF subfamily)